MCKWSVPPKSSWKLKEVFVKLGKKWKILEKEWLFFLGLGQFWQLYSRIMFGLIKRVTSISNGWKIPLSPALEDMPACQQNCSSSASYTGEHSNNCSQVQCKYTGIAPIPSSGLSLFLLQTTYNTSFQGTRERILKRILSTADFSTSHWQQNFSPSYGCYIMCSSSYSWAI